MTTTARPYGCTSMIRWPAVAPATGGSGGQGGWGAGASHAGGLSPRAGTVVPVTRTYVGRLATASLGTVMTVARVAAANARALTRSAGRNVLCCDGRGRSEWSISGAASTDTVTPADPRGASECR